MIANTLPLLTWRWLKVNESLIELPEVLDNVSNIEAKEGDKVSALFDIRNIDAENGNIKNNSRHIKINIVANKDSIVDIYYISRCQEEAYALTDIDVEVKENATVNMIQIEVGAKNTVTNYRAKLIEKKASTNIEAVYFSNNDNKLDIFYDIKHIGEETNSNILVNGALKDRARKNFKGTIDFLRGSRLSKGSEEEFVTLLDKDVRSIAVPVLLCQEDDVEGVHAASAGKIDQDILFYIMSRGLNIEQAKKMIVEIKLAPTIHKLPEKQLSQEIWDEIEARI